MKLTKALLLILIVAFAVGCTHHSVPKQIPPIGLDLVGTYDEKYSVSLINDQMDTSDNLYWTMGAHRYYANYNTWTKFFIDSYTTELQKRGVDVSDGSPNKLKVKISDFAFMQGMFVVRANMKVRVRTLDNKFEKEWVETDTSGWSGGRALGSTVYHAIQRLLNDPEVMNSMKTEMASN